MSIDIYPAFVKGAEVNHAADWAEEATMNLANGNFYQLMDTMGLSKLTAEVPGSMKLKSLEVALSIAPLTRYTDRLKALCAIAKAKKSNIIAFS